MGSASRLEVLGRVLEIANSSVDIGERLDNILSVICDHFGAKRTVLFLQEHAKSRLVKANTWPREPHPQEPMAFELGKSPVGECAFSRSPVSVDSSEEGAPEDLNGLMTGGDRATLWPVMDDNRLYGVLLMLLTGETDLEDEDTRLMQMVARELAGSIRNFRLYFDSKKRIAELNAISDLGRAAVSTIELSQLLDTVAGICAKLLGAKGGLVQVCDPKQPGAMLRAKHGRVPAFCLKGDLCENGCLPMANLGRDKVGEVARGQVDDADYEHGLCVPLLFKGDYKGHLCVFDKAIHEKGSDRRGFSDEERNLLNTMASMVSSALENALTFQRVEDLAERNEEMVSALATLFEISAVLMTTVDFGETVQILLHAATHPAGLNHNRAMLFLLDEEAGVLRPVADKVQEKAWGPTRELTHTLLDIKNSESWNQTLDDELSGLEVPLDPKQSVLALTALEKMAVEVPHPAEDKRVTPGFLEVFGKEPFLTVPMFAKGKVVGVMVVGNDNPANLFNDRDRKLMVMLANLGGLSVENSRLYHNLDQANRELAHMRNRLLEAGQTGRSGRDSRRGGARDPKPVGQHRRLHQAHKEKDQPQIRYPPIPGRDNRRGHQAGKNPERDAGLFGRHGGELRRIPARSDHGRRPGSFAKGTQGKQRAGGQGIRPGASQCILRRPPDKACFFQPLPERHAGHGGGGRHPEGAHLHPGAGRQEPGGRRGGRHRRRHTAGRNAQHIQPVFHHQGLRQRAGAFHSAQDSYPPFRPGGGPKPEGGRRHLHGYPAGGGGGQGLLSQVGVKREPP
jgi:GAF domain-containing protein